ncbi:hypothetical protein QR680_015106 [Steinernema hermaphroditum]|uniref:CAP-Gly domain-containing protein n=1 Tax=Steinernema hermaphroditum TaxID=289476 RepID=A0AA39IDG7_9BILA|nr:hypothetical protein QR680_015106 [Steinernema hermaphroditum]
MDFQSMLAKSTSGTAANRGPIISKADVGLRVLVGGGVSGTLRYVGPIIGKDGIFCGVELDYPEGKHNGSFQGVAYFHCPPQHGIFAPLYKVELDGSEPPRNPVTISQLKRPTAKAGEVVHRDVPIARAIHDDVGVVYLHSYHGKLDSLHVRRGHGRQHDVHGFFKLFQLSGYIVGE